MVFPELITEKLTLLAVIHPDLQNGTYWTPWFSMRNFHRLLAIVAVGDIAQGGTIDFELQEATSVVGAGAVAIAGKAITQLTQAGGDGDDVCHINLRAEEMNAQNDYEFVRGRLDVLNANANACVLIYGETPVYSRTASALVTEEVA